MLPMATRALPGVPASHGRHPVPARPTSLLALQRRRWTPYRWSSSTGQVGRAAIGSDAFQECDTTGITLPITKHNYLVMSAEEIPRVIKEAFYIANTGRPGPVLVDIPKDVFTEVAEFVYPDEIDLPGYNPTLKPHSGQVRRAAKLIEEAERPVILAGHGVIISRAYDELLELAEKAQIPVITTLLGVSSFPTGHVLSVGWPGMHGMAYASLAIEESDLLIALGMRFGRQNYRRH